MQAPTSLVKPGMLKRLIAKAPPSALIPTLKVSLEDRLKICRARFTILYEGEKADDNLTLHGLQVAKISVIIQQGEEITVSYVVEGKKERRRIQFLAENKMEDLMSVVLQYDKIPMRQQELLYNRDILPTTGTLAAAGLADSAKVVVRAKKITLQLQLPGGILIPMEAHALLAVEDLIDTIKAMKSEYKTQNIGLAGLSCGSTLGGLDIQDGQQITLVVLESRPARLRLCSFPNMNNIEIQTDLNNRVIDFKEQVRDQRGIPLDQQHYMFEGKMLEDRWLLSQYNIQDGATLIHLFTLRAC